MNNYLHILFALFILSAPNVLFSQTSNFSLFADTNAVRGNLNQAFSDCGACDARFHVIANNFYDKEIAWTLISAPSAYYNCGSSFFVDNYNCVAGDCTFHMHGVCPGEYVIAAQDLDYPGAPNTVVSDTITVIIRAVNSGSVTATTNHLTCHANLSGSITVQSSLPGPLTYSWSTGNSTSTINSLSAGTYTVMVTDNNKCVIKEQITLSEPDAILITPVFVNNQVPGPNIGSIDLNVSGGTIPYSYQWSTGATTQQINQLAAGNYMVTITDGNNCKENRTYRLGTDSIQTTGIIHLENITLDVFPNPFHEYINLHLNTDNLKEIRIEVLNLLGNKVYHQDFNKGDEFQNEINLSGFPNGIYFIKLTGYRLNKIVRIIKLNE